MKIVAILPVRNEDWILGLSLRALLMWVDEVVVLDHASTDRTADIIGECSQSHPFRVSLLTDSHDDWYEMDQRQQLLVMARVHGATHIVTLDCDEILSGNLLPYIRTYISAMRPGYILQLPGYNLRGSINRYHDNGIWGHRWFSTAFVDDARLHWSGDHFHQREPRGVPLVPYRPIRQGDGGVLHLWGASERRLVARHRLYKITERLRWPDKSVAEIDRYYNQAIKGTGWTYADVPPVWWRGYEHLMKYLDVDAEPWQESECKRLLAEHGEEKFKGLDLFDE